MEANLRQLFHCSAAAMLLCFASFAAASAPTDLPANTIAWRTGLTSSAQPEKSYLARLKEEKFEAVINLAPPKSSGSIELEGAIVANQGLVYVNIPVNFSKPTLRDFEFFSAAVKGSEGRKLLVHCQANFRAGSFVLLYRAIHENAAVSELASKLNAVWVPDPVWHAFIVDTLKHYGKDSERF